MAPHDLGCVRTDLIQSTGDHFVGYRIRKEYEQIRCSDLLVQAGTHLGKNLCFAVVGFAYFFILGDHPVMTSDDNNTHEISSLAGMYLEIYRLVYTN